MELRLIGCVVINVEVRIDLARVTPEPFDHVRKVFVYGIKIQLKAIAERDGLVQIHSRSARP